MGPAPEPRAVAFPRGNNIRIAAINWRPTSDSGSRHESAPSVRQRKRKPEHLGRRARPHAVRPDQLGRALPRQPPEVRVVGADLLVMRQPAPGQRAQAGLGRGRDGSDRARPQRREVPDQTVCPPSSQGGSSYDARANEEGGS